MTQITKHDALLAIDAAMAALASARVMVEAIGEDPAADADGCKHVRQTETFDRVMCRDCGASLGVPKAADAEPADMMPDERTTS